MNITLDIITTLWDQAPTKFDLYQTEKIRSKVFKFYF